MSDVIDRPMLEQEVAAKSRLRIIDCDIHPSLHSQRRPLSVLAEALAGTLKTYGRHLRTPYIGTSPIRVLAADRSPRCLAPTGGPPGSDLDFMRKQHLDPHDIEFGILQVLDPFIFSQQTSNSAPRSSAHQRLAARVLVPTASRG